MFYVEPARTELFELLKDPYHLDSFQELLELFVGHDGFDVPMPVKVRHIRATQATVRFILRATKAFHDTDDALMKSTC